MYIGALLGFRGLAGRTLLLLVSLSSIPAIAGAQDKDQFRDQAKSLEAQMRAQGEPSDRCSLGVYLGDGSVVVRTFGASNLKAGDKLLVVNQVQVADGKAEEVIAVLRGLTPTAMVPLTLNRQGDLLDIDVQCSNARTTTEALVTGLNLASRGRFDECVATFAQLTDLDARGMGLKAQCAALSRRAKNDAPSLLVQAMSMAIEDAYWMPSLRTELAKQLHGMEGQITQSAGASRYQALVAQTRTWPGGAEIFESTTPDWALFRRNAEAAVRNRLIDPESARIDFPYGFLLGYWKPAFSKRYEGYWTCGSVNARNRMGDYTGSTAFVVVLDSTGIVQFTDVGSSKDLDLVSASCGNSVKNLPPPPAQLSRSPNTSTTTGIPSVADELKKLVDLKNSGALTDAEFQTAKQKLLGTASL